MMDKYYFYQSYYDALKGLKPTVRYTIREAIDRYMFEDIEPVFKDTLSNSIWMLLLPTLKLSKVRYANGKQTKNKDEANLKQNGSKSEANLKQSQSKVEGNPEVCSSISKDKGERRKDKGKEKKDKEKSATASSPSRFHKPTVDEVRAYIQESGYHVNPNDFVNFYESKGWLVGKSPMKDWKAAVRTWESKEKNENPSKFAEEKEDEYHPIVPLDRCHVCDSKNVSTQGLYSQCNACGVTYVWNSKKGEWREEC